MKPWPNVVHASCMSCCGLLRVFLTTCCASLFLPSFSMCREAGCCNRHADDSMAWHVLSPAQRPSSQASCATGAPLVRRLLFFRALIATPPHIFQRLSLLRTKSACRCSTPKALVAGHDQRLFGSCGAQSAFCLPWACGDRSHPRAKRAFNRPIVLSACRYSALLPNRQSMCRASACRYSVFFEACHLQRWSLYSPRQPAQLTLAFLSPTRDQILCECCGMVKASLKCFACDHATHSTYLHDAFM